MKIEDTSVLHFANVEEIAQQKYLDYAMSVITARALPDVRDGLKPVQRRILYAMHVLKSSSNGVYKKSARIVGDVIGKYHPHGDTSVYDAMVRVAQPFSMRLLLIDGQGNFGSVDGDSAAAMRYCFSGDTRIMTEKGLVKFQDIPSIYGLDGDTINIDMKVNSLTKQEKAVKWLFSGYQNVVKLTTDKGYNTTCTSNEPLYVLDKNLNYTWKNVEDIYEGDHVCLNTKNDVKVAGGADFQYHYVTNSREKNVTLPEKMSVDFAKFLGYLLSDGSMRMAATSLEFGSSDIEIFNDFKGLVNRLFSDASVKERIVEPNKNTKIVSSKTHYYINLNSTKIINFLSYLGVKPCYAKDKTIPEIIFKSSQEEVSAFISAYYEGDGSCSRGKNHHEVALSSASYALLEQMKLLLLNYFGIISNKIHDDKGYAENKSYRLDINSSSDIALFKDKIEFLSSNKIHAINLCHKIYSNSVSFKRNYIPNLSSFISNYINDLEISSKYIHDEDGNKCLKQNIFKEFSLAKFKSVKTEFKLEHYLSMWSDEAKSRFPKLYQKLSSVLSAQYYYDKVTSIKELEEKIPVYDLTVENTHAFVANGFIAHNTEARFHKFSESMFEDIHLNTVDMQPNYDGTESEPKVLPLEFPNLLINGVQGIAVGMASNIPPHNPVEVMKAVKYLVSCKQDNIEPSIDDLISIIPAPDFPTKGIVHGTSTMKEAWLTGRGKMKLRARWKEEKIDGRSVIVVYELPYQVNKEKLKAKITELGLPISDKDNPNFGSPEVNGIYDVIDESDKFGMRLCIYLKAGYEPEIVFNTLLKITQLEESVNYNATVIVRGEPRVLGLQAILEEFILHRDEVIMRRTKTLYEKNLARERILEALMKAVHPDNLDNLITLIRAAKEVKDAREQIMTMLDIDEGQSNAILALNLKHLTGLEIESMKAELEERHLQNIEYREILSNQNKRYEIIQQESDRQIEVFASTKEDMDKYWVLAPYERRLTEIHENLIKTDLGSLTKEEDCVLLYTHEGYIRRCPVEDFKEQRRGTQGNKKFDLHKGDYIVNTIDANSHDTIMFITEKGQAFTINAYEVGTSLGGRHINNLLSNKKEGDKIAKILPVNFEDESELTLITQSGLVKRGKIQDYKTASVYKAGIQVMRISEDDKIFDAHITTNNNDLMFFKSDNTVSRTAVENFTIKKGRVTSGISGTKLTSKLAGVVSIDRQDEKGMVATVTDNGLVKISYVNEYRQTSRNSKGVKAFKESERSGNLVKAAYIDDLEQDIIVVTKKGMVNRISLGTFRVSSRVSTGFKLIDLSKNDEIVSVFIVKSEEETQDEIRDLEPELETL